MFLTYFCVYSWFFPIFLIGFGPLPLNFYNLPFSLLYIYVYMGFPGGKLMKNPPANAGDKTDRGLVPGSGRSPGVGYSDSLQYFCLENTMDRGDWQATVHEVTKNQIWLSNSIHTCTHAHTNTHMYTIYIYICICLWYMLDIFSSFSLWFCLWCVALPCWLSGKESTCQAERCGFDPWVRKIP